MDNFNIPHNSPKNLAEHKAILADALWEEEYVEYLVDEGPLLAVQLPQDLRDTEVFRDCRNRFGWPDESDASIMPLPEEDYEFDSANADYFLGRFFSIYAVESGVNLDNFRVLLMATPNQQPFNSMSANDVYGTHPVLHRLYVLMPDEMEAIKVLLADLAERHRGNGIEMAGELLEADNVSLSRMLMMIYGISSRLLKVDDKRRQQKILFPDKPAMAANITDAYLELRT